MPMSSIQTVVYKTILEAHEQNQDIVGFGLRACLEDLNPKSQNTGLAGSLFAGI